DKAHAIAQTFRVCLPEFAYFTLDDWLHRERDNWQEVADLQLGWDITDFGRGDFNQTGPTLQRIRNGARWSDASPTSNTDTNSQLNKDDPTTQNLNNQKKKKKQ
ncbi:D-lyxose/D-mannose family sugar isomerase, partial [Escherichia coli]|uniref:D-lyxose/D-mannose family sugar isomerase n=1 Tax=Escherichia coli TaxID=562 RepID=UPI0010CB6254